MTDSRRKTCVGKDRGGKRFGRKDEVEGEADYKAWRRKEGRSIEYLYRKPGGGKIDEEPEPASTRVVTAQPENPTSEMEKEEKSVGEEKDDGQIAIELSSHREEPSSDGKPEVSSTAEEYAILARGQRLGESGRVTYERKVEEALS